MFYTLENSLTANEEEYKHSKGRKLLFIFFSTNLGEYERIMLGRAGSCGMIVMLLVLFIFPLLPSGRISHD